MIHTVASNPRRNSAQANLAPTDAHRTARHAVYLDAYNFLIGGSQVSAAKCGIATSAAYAAASGASNFLWRGDFSALLGWAVGT